MEKKQRRQAPLKLAWPGGGGGGRSSLGRPATLVSLSQASDDSGSRKRKRRDAKMWVDKYAPTTAADLCVAPKKVKELRGWMQSHENHGGLLVFVGSPGVGKSSAVRVLASELGWEVHEWSDSYSSQYYGGSGSLASVDHSNSLESFQDFLQHAGAGFAPLQLSNETAKHSSTITKSVIMLDELPNLHNAEAEEQFRETMSRHIRESSVPTVLIFSDVREGKHEPRELERLVDAQDLHSDAVTFLQCHPVTKARMKKTLQNICKKEGIAMPSADFWEEVHLQSSGDLRNAIMSLQFRGHVKKSNTHSEARDSKLSMFHTLGKVLYAKREKTADDDLVTSDARPPLTFNPDTVLEQSGMGLSGALTFLGFHSPAFFTDVSELSEAFNHYSDAATLLGREMQRDYSESVFPGGYASCIAGRAVADANKHPAPNSFRSLCAPKIFEVTRNQRANEVSMAQLRKRLSGFERLPLDSNVGGSRTFVTDRLPFMRTIVPQDVDNALQNLYSHVRPNVNAESAAQSELAARLEEQKKILELDDIVEDDSSMEEVRPPRRNSLKQNAERKSASPPDIISLDV